MLDSSLSEPDAESSFGLNCGPSPGTGRGAIPSEARTLFICSIDAASIVAVVPSARPWKCWRFVNPLRVDVDSDRSQLERFWGEEQSKVSCIDVEVRERTVKRQIAGLTPIGSSVKGILAL